MPTSPSTKRNRQFRIDATRPFYAAVGAGDLAVAYARNTATEVQARVGRLQDLQVEPKALREQAVATVEARIAELQADAKALPGRVEQVVNEYVAELNKAIEELNKNYTDLASRGESFVARVRRQEATKQTQSAAKTTTENKTAAKADTAAKPAAKASTTKPTAKAPARKTTAKKDE